MKSAKSVLAASIVLACGVGFAKEAQSRQGFNDMDKDADGRLTRTEAAGNKDLIARWSQADADNDGVLTRGEYLMAVTKKSSGEGKQQAAAKEDKKRMSFNDMDTNDDGLLSGAEAAGNPRLTAKWSELDTNKDGSLSRGEYLTEMARQDTSRAREQVSRTVDNMKRDETATAGGSAAAGATARPTQSGTPHQ